MEDGGRSVEEAAQGVRRKAEELASDAQQRLEGMRGYAEDAGEFVRSFARERPLAAVGMAVGLGFVLGRLLSRA
ncbi:MAG: hypothetical protein QM767_20215 [Anaeromyxobacter sp.]